MCFQHNPLPWGEGGPLPALSPARQPTGPGEGLLGRGSKLSVKQFSGTRFCSRAGLIEATAISRIGTEQYPSICEVGLNLLLGNPQGNSFCRPSLLTVSWQLWTSFFGLSPSTVDFRLLTAALADLEFGFESTLQGFSPFSWLRFCAWPYLRRSSLLPVGT